MRAQFEQEYASIVGEGDAVAFASGRMGFFVLMEELGVGNGDEVVLPGATCSVMVNAVLRAGAQPVYADIDPQSFGSDPKEIERAISPRTRMIVAQHSFGIPCNIVPIVALARLRNIFLLEDCALTLGSKVNGKTVGNFGDAALFSTDHSKPINTLTGGLIYSRNQSLVSRLRVRQGKCGDLSAEKQQALFNRLLLERKYCHPGKYGRIAMFEYFMRVWKRREKPFLDDDFGTNCRSSYPYPAKFPGFLAKLGLLEIERWPHVAEERRILMKSLLDAIDQCGLADVLPSAYRDANRNIVPLRLAWHAADGARQRQHLSNRVDVSWTWFMQPIVATQEPLGKFGYRSGSCPVSEALGPKMVNLPCNVPVEWSRRLAECLHLIVKDEG